MNKKELCARKIGVIVAGALFYAVLYAVGAQIEQSGVTIPGEALKRITWAFPVAAAILYGLFAYVFPHLETTHENKKKAFCTWGAWIVLFCCYVPVFLIHYPGSFQYDSSDEVAQIARGQYTQMHPMLHTLFVRFCISCYSLFQSMEKVSAMSNLIQMALVSLCFALVCASISRSVSRRAARIACVFFALHPAHMAFASNCTKDVLFAAFFALFFALCMEEVCLGRISRGLRAVQLTSGVLAILLRNNTIFAIVVWVIILLFSRAAFRRMMLCAGLAIVLACGANGIMAHMLNAEPGRLTEGLSLPIQQMGRARVYASEYLSEEGIRQMDAYLVRGTDAQAIQDYYAMYTPTLSDPLKNNANHALIEADLPGFLGTWWRIGAKCPRVYLDAFLNLALPSLYPYREYKLGVRYIEMGCNLSMTVHYALAPIVQPRRFAGLREWLDKTFYLTGADDNPVLRWLFNTGFLFWVMFAFVFYDMYRGNWARVTIMLLPVFFWVTYLLGPIMQGRYVYPFICMLPVIVFRRKKPQTQEE